jgi:hypothetical protein
VFTFPPLPNLPGFWDNRIKAGWAFSSLRLPAG